MNRCILLSTLVILLIACKNKPALIDKKDALQRFENLNPEIEISKAAFVKGLTEFRKFEGAKDYDKITIVDFTLPSTKNRLFVYDIAKEQIVFKSLCSHGINSGELYANDFSNQHKSYKSSKGFYLTDEVYQGKHGTSLRLVGLEKGKNDNAKQRGIVLHGADYCSEEHITKNGMLGRSKGCPAVPHEKIAPLIKLLKAGSILYIHAE